MFFIMAKKTVKRRRLYGIGRHFPRNNKKKKSIFHQQFHYHIIYNSLTRKISPSSEFLCFPIIDEQEVIAKEATSEPDASVQLLEDSVLAL